jgi:hypothetical protein
MFKVIINNKKRDEFPTWQEAYNFCYTFCQTAFVSDPKAIFDPEKLYLQLTANRSYWVSDFTSICIHEVTIPSRKE